MSRHQAKIQSEFPMAIQPIDLQTMYTQLGKISKQVVHEQQGAQLQRAIQQEEDTKRLQEKNQAVEKTSMDEEGIPLIQDPHKGTSSEENTGKKHEPEQQNEESPQEEFQVIKDPNLGQHIDVSG